MDRLDNIFLRIIQDEHLASTFDIDSSKYGSLDEGKKALNPQVRAIAETISLLNKKIGEVKTDMKMRNKVGQVVLTDNDYQPIYRKIVTLLSAK